MRGDPGLGAVLRELRASRGLTLASVARRAGCAASLLSQVETGGRQLQPWLAECLDAVYGTGGAVAALLDGSYPGSPRTTGNATPRGDVLVVRLPRKGHTVPVSRRELLATLGIGALGGPLLGPVEHALGGLMPTGELLAEMERTLDGFHAAARAGAPAQLVDGLTGQVAVIDVVRRRGPDGTSRDFTILQARYADLLSWMREEAGDLHGALYWTDRAAQWAQAARWVPMVSYTFVRRSMLSLSFRDDGLRAAENARYVLEMPDAPARVKGLAAKQMGYGYALARQADDSARALDLAMRLLSRPQGEDELVLGNRSLANDDLLAIYQTTCDIYLGRGETPIATLEPRLSGISTASRRKHAITCAKLARAYANAGQPDQACDLMLQTLDAAQALGSQTARTEIRRALPVLANWPKRADVREVRHRLNAPQAPPSDGPTAL